jgi:hypothetical protein
MLRGTIETAKERYRKDKPNEKTTVEVTTFVNRSKKIVEGLGKYLP